MDGKTIFDQNVAEFGVKLSMGVRLMILATIQMPVQDHQGIDGDLEMRASVVKMILRTNQVALPDEIDIDWCY